MDKSGWVEEITEIIIAGKPIISIIRYKENWESFTWSCNASYFWPYRVVLKNASMCPTFTQARAVIKHFFAKGITDIEWDRRKGVGIRRAKLKIGGRHGRRHTDNGGSGPEGE